MLKKCVRSTRRELSREQRRSIRGVPEEYVDGTLPILEQYQKSTRGVLEEI